MEPTLPTRSEIVQAYLEYLRTNEDKLFWAWGAVEVEALDRPEEMWHLILDLLAGAESGYELGRIAGGPLESLLDSGHGPRYMERMWKVAPTLPRLRRALAACWLSKPEQVDPDSVIGQAEALLARYGVPDLVACDIRER